MGDKDGPPELADFTEAEWLAIVPTPPAPRGSGTLVRGGGPGPARPGLDRRTLLREVRRCSAFLLFLLEVHLAAVPWASRIVLRTGLWSLCTAAVVLSELAFNDGRYATPQLAAGISAALFYALLVFLMVAVPSAWLGTFKNFAPAAGGRAGAAAPGEVSYDAHSLAGLVRWSQLVRSGKPEGPGAAETDHERAADPPGASASPLVRHQDGDPLCPCGAPNCGGKLVRSAPVLCLAEALFRMVPLTAGPFLIVANPLLVHAAAFWSSAWAVAGALAVLANLDFVPLNVAGRFNTNASLLRLSLRIQRRAMFLALGSFLDAFERAIFSGDPPPRPPDGALYAKLHHRLASIWERRVSLVLSGRTFLGGIGVAAGVPLVLCLAAGSCIPAYVAVTFGFLLCVTVTDLAHVALSNAQIDGIAELYREAQAEIRDKLVRARSLPSGPDRAGLLEALGTHDRLLASFREAAGFRGRFLGFVVDFGVLRTFLVTVFTLAIGLWSVLRGSVFFTLGSVCPTR